MKTIFTLGVIALVIYAGVLLFKNGEEVLKKKECNSQVSYMNLYEDGTQEYKKHSDKFFELGCNPKEYK